MKRTSADNGGEAPKKPRSKHGVGEASLDDQGEDGVIDLQPASAIAGIPHSGLYPVDEQVLSLFSELCDSARRGKVAEIAGIMQHAAVMASSRGDEAPILSSIACGLVMGLASLENVIDPDAEVRHRSSSRSWRVLICSFAPPPQRISLMARTFVVLNTSNFVRPFFIRNL